MGKDFESWLHHQQPDRQFPNTKSLKPPFDLGMQNTDIPCAIPCTEAVPFNCSSPAFGFSGLPNFTPGQLEEPHGWFYCLPRFRQGLIPDMTLHEKFIPKTNLPSKVPSTKQFLVFDQTGNKTTMIFSSGVDTPIQKYTSWSPKSTGDYCSGPNMTDELNEDDGISEGSEMREDTEEINALLYSDDDGNYSDNGEETSTGHSPSTMTAYEKDWFEGEDMDEVASSAGPVKRQKVSDSGYEEVASVTNNASCSVRPNRSLEYEDDAESSCARVKPGNKRDRKEKIRETVNILQTIIPSGKGKDAVVVLDEAINYLRTLKNKANSLGLSTL